MRALSFTIEYNAVAEFPVTNALAQANSEFGARLRRAGAARRRAHRPGHQDTRTNFLHILVRNLGNKPRWLRKIVHAVQTALLGIGNVQGLLGARNADVTKPAFLFQPVRVGNRSLVGKQPVFHSR